MTRVGEAVLREMLNLNLRDVCKGSTKCGLTFSTHLLGSFLL